MGITQALANATSGLAATSRLADTVSENVANAMTPGFGTRTTSLSSVSLGGYGSGVRVTGTERAENAWLTSERRATDASLGAAATTSEAWNRIMAALGEPGAADALSTRATALETTLMAATAQPQSTSMLADAVSAADALAGSINRIAAENAALRTEADSEIARQVGFVNAALHDIDNLNNRIMTLTVQGRDSNALQDERARLIDSIAPVIPLRTVSREHGQVALYSAAGGVLLDGRVFELAFEARPGPVTPEMSLGAPLSGLAQDQGAAAGPVAIAAGTGNGRMDGGTLGALFDLRDNVIVEYDAELDSYAADLIDRFTTLVPAAGLDGAGNGIFVDSAPGALTGLAGRIGINAAVDPGQGGSVWRLRDGLSAAAPGNAGDGVLLQALTDAMTTRRTPSGFMSQTADAGSSVMAYELSSFFANRAADSDERRAFLGSSLAVLAEQEINATGVDTDSELQTLMLIEQAYAANAQVLSSIDQMMNLILEI